MVDPDSDWMQDLFDLEMRVVKWLDILDLVTEVKQRIDLNLKRGSSNSLLHD